MSSGVAVLLAKGQNPMKPKTRDIGKNKNSQFKKILLYMFLN